MPTGLADGFERKALYLRYGRIHPEIGSPVAPKRIWQLSNETERNTATHVPVFGRYQGSQGGVNPKLRVASQILPAFA